MHKCGVYSKLVHNGVICSSQYFVDNVIRLHVWLMQKKTAYFPENVITTEERVKRVKSFPLLLNYMVCLVIFKIKILPSVIISYIWCLYVSQSITFDKDQAWS